MFDDCLEVNIKAGTEEVLDLSLTKLYSGKYNVGGHVSIRCVTILPQFSTGGIFPQIGFIRREKSPVRIGKHR